MGFARAPAVEALQRARGTLPEAVQLLLDDREDRERVRGELPSLAARSCSGEALRDEHFADQLQTLLPMQDDGLVKLHPESIELTDLGQMFMRNVAVPFDSYFAARQKEGKTGEGTFSKTL